MVATNTTVRFLGVHNTIIFRANDTLIKGKGFWNQYKFPITSEKYFKFVLFLFTDLGSACCLKTEVLQFIPVKHSYSECTSQKDKKKSSSER